MYDSNTVICRNFNRVIIDLIIIIIYYHYHIGRRINAFSVHICILHIKYRQVNHRGYIICIGRAVTVLGGHRRDVA